LNGIELTTLLQWGFRRIILILFNFIFHLLIDNSFVSYRLCDFWYEAKKKAKKYAKERELSGWKNVTVWKNSRPPYISEVVWVEYIHHVISERFVRYSESNTEN
jgi:hypothetical protein